MDGLNGPRGRAPDGWPGVARNGQDGLGGREGGSDSESRSPIGRRRAAVTVGGMARVGRSVVSVAACETSQQTRPKRLYHHEQGCEDAPNGDSDRVRHNVTTCLDAATLASSDGLGRCDSVPQACQRFRPIRAHPRGRRWQLTGGCAGYVTGRRSRFDGVAARRRSRSLLRGPVMATRDVSVSYTNATGRLCCAP